MQAAQGMCIKIQIDGALNCSHMCMCIKFITQDQKQMNAHVAFPVGMESETQSGKEDHVRDSESFRDEDSEANFQLPLVSRWFPIDSKIIE